MSRQRPPVIPPHEKRLKAGIFLKESLQKSDFLFNFKIFYRDIAGISPSEKMCDSWIKTVGFPVSFFFIFGGSNREKIGILGGITMAAPLFSA